MARNRFSAPETKARSGAQQTVIDGPFAETKELIAGSFWPDPGEVERRDDRVGQRSPNQMEDESDDFDSVFTPELSEQEERVGG